MTIVKYVFEDGTTTNSYGKKCELEETKGKAAVEYEEHPER